jgi:RHS repeat-associated protein
MPTDYGFTGQRADAATGLDFYNARYYDPAAGQFASADTALAGGLNRYVYVGDSPENATDPSGHIRCFGDGPGACGSKGSGSSTPMCSRVRCGDRSAAGPYQRMDPLVVQLVGQIVTTFHDPRTVLLLITRLYSATGRRFLPFLVQAGQNIGGDSYIKWGNLGLASSGKHGGTGRSP